MQTLARTGASAAWLVLVALTLISWALGVHHNLSGRHVAESLIVIVIAVFKIRLVGLYFMELRDAPWWLRGSFECYCLGVLIVLETLYLRP